MAGRILDDWMATYMEWTDGTESPENYHLWTGMGVLGAAMGQNWMNGDVGWDMANNLFFILFAKQGKTRKSTAIEYGLDLLDEIAEVRVSPSSVSKEELHRQMSDCINDHKESNYIVYAKELSSVIKTSGIDTPNFLIALFDQTKKFENSTIGRGSEMIMKPHISFMSATTPNFIKSGFGGLDMRENGLMSRTALIYADGPRNPNAFGSRPDKDTKLKLIHDLKYIAAGTDIQGKRQKLMFEPDAKQYYSDYYDNLKFEIPRNPLEEALLARKELHVMKVCCILTVAKRPRDDGSNIGLKIQMEEVLRAIKIVEQVQEDTAHIHELLGTDPNLHVKLNIRERLTERKKIKLAMLNKMFFTEIDGMGMKNILNQMVESEQIRIDGDWVYWVTD